MPFTKLLPTSIDLAQNFTFTGTVAGISAGKVLQVVTATSDNNATTTSTSFATHSSFPTVSITPSSSSNKVYVLCVTSVEVSSGYTAYYTLYRNDTTNLGTSGDGLTKTQVGGSAIPGSMGILDSPSSTSAVEYQLYAKSSNSSGQAYVGKGVKQTITAFEIEG